ncbi:Aste57867_9369 [Aphanomyces stellatus]|uniref:Aste57867_9369 protein n=1 Tax=Aphanomyces stellatus TaxID=120398 RepID=A0A485KMP2_9STRA|nr:hypothetical protein As57867_009333 [Aphanomyces stellatus]VFT86250.1 Aste57867_9369 [Aphanomyces stellatus]
MLDDVVHVRTFNDFGFECRGIFASVDLPQGTRVWHISPGELLEIYTKADILAHPEKDTLIMYSYMRDDDGADASILSSLKYAVEFDSTLDASKDPSFYFNHSCAPNCWFNNDDTITTRRDVKQGEQLTYDYACTETESSLHYGMQCLCGAATCRGVLTFSQWRNRAFIMANQGHVSQYIARKHAENGWSDPRVEVRHKGDKAAKGLFARLQPDAAIAAGDTVLVFSGKIVHGDDMTVGISKREFEMSLQVAPRHWQIPAWKGDDVIETPDYVNHSCDPSCGMKDSVTVMAIRDIAPGDEITIDYAMVNDGAIAAMTSTGSDAFDCECGSANCRGQITPTDWQLPELQARIGDYFSPFVKDLVRKSQISSP